MGCDIHAYLEVRRFRDDERKEGIWVNADKWTRNQFGAMHPEHNEQKYEIEYNDSIYAGRHYYLFAILAGVRNYWDIKPISEPKGVPEDASEEIKAQCEWWDCDGHSHSWLSLAELIAYDWDKKENGTDWMINAEELEEAKKKYGNRLHTIIPKKFGFEIEYDSSAREICSKFADGTIERMKSFVDIREDYPQYSITPDDIRIVFWFDN